MSVKLLAETILGFVGIVGVGLVLRAAGLLKREDARPINAVIIYAGLPAMIFRAVHGAQLGSDLAVVAGIAWAIFVLTALIAWAVARALKLARPVAGGFILATALGNTGYIGYPISQAVLGDAGLVRAIFYDVFGTVGALILVGLFIAEKFGSGEEGPINLWREVLGFPAVWGLALGLALRSVTIPIVVSDGLEALASLVVPLIMISVGLSLTPASIRTHAAPLVTLAGLRLVAAPLVALALGSAVLADPAAVRLVVLEAGMPTMMLTLVVGGRFRLDTDFIASAILVTTVTSIVSIPLLQLLVR